MSGKTKKEHFILDFAENLSSALQILPSDFERERITKDLEIIIQYFKDLRERVKSLPDTKNRDEIVSAVATIKNFLESAIENPAIAPVLGLPYGKRIVPSKPRRKEIPSQIGERLFNELKELSTEQIQEKLLNYKSASMDELRSLATYLGIKYEQRIKRQELVDKIVKIGFANIRGYEILRSGNNKER